MAGILITELRRAVLTHMKADAALTAIVPAAQLYPATVPANPAWPFGRFDSPQSFPLDGGCYAGATVSFLYHAFAKDRLGSNGATLETAEDHAARIASAMKQALHDRRLAIPSMNTTARIAVRSVRLVQDGAEASAWHAILSCTARIMA